MYFTVVVLDEVFYETVVFTEDLFAHIWNVMKNSFIFNLEQGNSSMYKHVFPLPPSLSSFLPTRKFSCVGHQTLYRGSAGIVSMVTRGTVW